ncbi:hypothetical protein MOV08_01210 [Streptomyces yunnanensis]|uniref:VOC domain-containing protein n=1 Tax=Streptomyces yunnanensis TaxID=156453 RepID=A0ABY8A188_9ACTN|nr:hypothetical protein [Streptomyces yunnanensis]WEB38061.1 hypothetical protein MOV08_01210 [Streptomyces yunnanensis]
MAGAWPCATSVSPRPRRTADRLRQARRGIAPCLAVKDPLAIAAFYQKLGFGVLDTGPLNPEHPLLIITHDGKPALMIQTDSSLRALLPAMQRANGCSGIRYFTAADFDATVERIRPHVDVVKDTVPNYDRTGRVLLPRPRRLHPRHLRPRRDRRLPATDRHRHRHRHRNRKRHRQRN